MEAVDLSTTKFKGRVILGIGEKRISHDDSESSSNSEKSHQNPYMEYRMTMKAKSKSSQNGPSAKESGELLIADQEPKKENTYDTDSNDSIDGKNRRDKEAG